MAEQTTPLKTNPRWDTVTTFAVNLLDVNTHYHGNKRFYKGQGTAFVRYDDAVNVLHRVLTAESGERP